jgi:hypothetical protein
MKSATSFLAALLLASSLGASNTFAAANGVISNSTLTPRSYCHLTFPAITEESLATDHPVLESPSTGEIIDFYGPCNTNPVGQDQVQSQRNRFDREFEHNYND